MYIKNLGMKENRGHESMFSWFVRRKSDTFIYVKAVLVFDRIDKPTMTGKMVYPIVDKFVVQWKEQKNVYSTNRIDVASSKRTCFAH